MKEANTFTDLLAEYIDGTPSAKQLEQFVSLLKSSSENRKEFRQAMRLHTLSRELIVEDSLFMQKSDSKYAENLPFDPKRKSRPTHMWWLRTAAALILVATIWMYVTKEKAKPDYMDLTWFNSVPQGSIQNYPEDVVSIIDTNGEKVSIDFRKPKIQTGRGEDLLFGENVSLGGNQSFGSGSPPNSKKKLSLSQRLDAAIKNFIKSCDFKFAIPKTLPEGWKLINIQHISDSRKQLIYRQKDALFTVILWPDSGKDLKTTTYETEGKQRQFKILRKGGLVIAIEVAVGTDIELKIITDKFIYTDKKTPNKRSK